VRLRNTDRAKYNQRKEKIADMLISIVEKYLVPDLRKHIVVRDVASPALMSVFRLTHRFDLRHGSSAGEFGANRLPVKTPSTVFCYRNSPTAFSAQ